MKTISRAAALAGATADVAALDDPEQPGPGARALEGALARTAQRSDNCMASSMSARLGRQPQHSSSCIAMSEPSRRWMSIERSGDSSNLAPSICERNVTAFGDLAQLRQRQHLEAAGVGQDRPVPAGELVQAAKRAIRSSPGRSMR